MQVAVGDDGSLPGTDGHGDAPGGSDTRPGPPGPVISRSWPQMAPGVDGSLPGTSSHDEDGAPARATPEFAGSKETAVAAATAAAAAKIANRRWVLNAVLRRERTVSLMLLC